MLSAKYAILITPFVIYFRSDCEFALQLKCYIWLERPNEICFIGTANFDRQS